MKIDSKKLSQRILNVGTAFVLALSSVSGSVPFIFAQTANATPVGINISTVPELRYAIEHQADGQTWTIEPGTYGLTPFNTISEKGETGWYFPITANNLTINGVGNPTIYGTGFTANGNWSTQDFVSVFGDNVTMNGLTLMPKVEPNKTVEVLGSDFTLENTTIEPNTLTDQSEYDSISDSTWAQQAKQWGGSLYFNHAGNQTVENVTIKNAGISYRYSPVGTNIAFSNVKLDYSTNVDWINGYRYSSGFNEAGNTVTGTPSVVYHVSSALNNLTSVLSKLQNGDTIELDSDLTVTQQISLTKAVTVNGNGHTVSASFPKTDNDNNAAIGVLSNDVTINNLTVDGTGGHAWPTGLHGINIYQSTGVALNSVTAKNFSYSGVNVNGSAVTVTDITTAGNGWHGIDVDKAGAVLTINGTSHHSDVIPVYVDTVGVGQVIDTNNQYGSKDNVLAHGDRVYGLKPGVPTLQYPANNGYVATNNFWFDWNDVSDAAQYEVQYSQNPAVGSDGGFQNVAWTGDYQHNQPTESKAHSVGANGTWYWQVRTVNAVGIKSDWSPVWKMTIDMNAPTVPVITSPNNGDYFKTGSIVNKWNQSTDATSGIAGYQIAYNYDDGHSFGGTTCSGLTMAGYSGFIGCRDLTGTTRNHTPSINEQGGVTIWVRAKDGAGNYSAWSTPVHYYYDATAPSKPFGLKFFAVSDNLVYSLNDMVIKRQAIYPQWDAVTTDVKDNSEVVDHYNYQSRGGYTTTIAGTDASANSTIKNWVPPTDRSDGYRVQAVDKAGNVSAWSDWMDFTYDSTPPTISLDTSLDGKTLQGPVDVTGSVSDVHPDHYWLQVKKNGAVVYSNTTYDLSNFSGVLRTLNGDGVYEVTLAARDAAGGTHNSGNRSGDVSITFTIDNTAPNAPTATPTESDGDTTAVALSATDNAGGSGIGSIYYTLDGSDPSDVNNSNRVEYAGDIALDTNQTQTIRAVAYDNAGNVSAGFTDTYNLAPVITNEGSVTPTTSSVTLQWDTSGDPSTSRVIYDIVSHNTLGAATANYGYAFTTAENSNKVEHHSVTVTGLNAGVQYYFRMVSHGSPETVSGEVASVTKVKSQGGTPTYQVAFVPNSTSGTSSNQTSDNSSTGVLGTETQKSDNKSNSSSDKNVLGTETSHKNDGGVWNILGLAWYWWILILAAIAAIARWLYGRFSQANA